MGRPGKVKVDYFPHVTNTGKTIAILESRWGNDGYSFWFKLLELLGNTNGFCYNCNSSSDWEYLLSKTRVEEETAVAILDKLADIEAIDAGLWGEKMIWSDNFVTGVVPAFEKRKSEIPQKPVFGDPKHAGVAVSSPGNVPAGTAAGFAGPETGRGEERNREEKDGEEIDGRETLPRLPSRRKHACPSALRVGVTQLADTVYLKPEEVSRLSREHGAEGAKRMVELLDAYKTNHPDKCAEYRDDYKVITAWVMTRYREERVRLDVPARSGSPGRSFAMGKLEQLAKEAAEDEAV